MRASDRSLESVAYRWSDVDEHHKRKRLQGTGAMKEREGWAGECLVSVRAGNWITPV